MAFLEDRGAPRGHLEVIVVYTDSIFGSAKTAGDLPLVIGSFTGDLDRGVWKIKANPEDVFRPQAEQPTGDKFAGLLKNTNDKLRDKTGYELRSRPAELLPYDRSGNPGKVKDAFEMKKINTELDTGYDIIRRK